MHNFEIKCDFENCEKLMIVAHPDDETFWGGYELLKGGYFVVCVTNGYNAKRKNDFFKVLSISNNKGIILSFKDTLNNKKFASQEQDVKAILTKIILAKNWKKIITHNKKGEYGHTHHKLICRWVSEIAKSEISYFNYHSRFYFWFHHPVPKEMKLAKQNLINVYKKSQFIASYWFRYSLNIE